MTPILAASLLEMIHHGGPMMLALIGCSVVGVGVVFERWETLRKAEATTAVLLHKVSEALKNGDVQAGIAICEENPGPVAATLGVGLRKLVLLESIGKKPEEIETGIVEAMEEHGGHVVNYLERNLTTLATCASLGPILGMIGTVIGMIKAFGTAAAMGQLTPAAVALGISEALVATAGGLIVAAIGTVFFNYFSTRVNRLVLEVQAAATEMVERLLESRAHGLLARNANATNSSAESKL